MNKTILIILLLIISCKTTSIPIDFLDKEVGLVFINETLPKYGVIRNINEDWIEFEVSLKPVKNQDEPTIKLYLIPKDNIKYIYFTE